MKKQVQIMILGLSAMLPLTDALAFPFPWSDDTAVLDTLEKACENVDYAKKWTKLCDTLKTSSGEVNNNSLQEIKNFMALSQLKQAKSEAEQLYQLPPSLNQVIETGFREKQANDFLEPVKTIYGKYFNDWNMLMKVGEADKNYFIDSHRQTYCSDSEAKAEVCQPATGHQIPLDLSVSTLLDSAVLSSQERQEAANLYIRNLTNPVPIPLMPKEKLFKNVKKGVLSDTGRENLEAKYRQQTLLSLAQNSFLTMMADRMPFEKGNSNSAPMSREALLEQEAQRRFNSTDWYQEMSTLSTPALLREIANMEALRLVMETRNSQRLERMEALMAAQLSFMAQTIGQAEMARSKATEVESNYEQN